LTVRLCALLAVIAASACGRSGPYTYRDLLPGLPDAGVPDSASSDAGAPDAGFDFCSLRPNGGCDPNALCSNRPAEPACTCKPGFMGNGFTCTSIAASLDGLRWELPCVTLEPQAPDYVCITTTDVNVSTTLTGVPGKRYDIRLRIRGVVETKQYTGGQGDGGHWMIGGTPAVDAWNIYRLSISAPAQVHHLNHGASGLYVCVGLDEVITVRANAGATVSLYASAVDSNRSQIRNNVSSPIVVPGIPPAPASYDGQFIQMDVLGVLEAP
jgi:hypothetical protein